jgi:diguanylate cyclase (GGDEF)-like protein
VKEPDSILSPDADARKILLIGDIDSAFSDVGTIERFHCEVESDIFEAIDMAAKRPFAVIAVVMSGSALDLGSALKALREVSCDAKIILLAQMYEEPTAIELVGASSNGTKTADDYLICPMEVAQFYQSVISTGSRQPVREGAAADYATRMKIKHLEKLATEDELTGLKNRRYIWEFFRQIIERAGGRAGRVTLLVFDIDDFKHYNDVYGHSAGDEILKQAAVLMQRCCRSHDVVGRIGGDEFAVVFWEDPQRVPDKASERRSLAAEHPKEAIFIAKRFRKELEKAELNLLGPEGKGILTISGGLASFPRDGSTVQQLFGQADKALLEAKRSGKNRIYLVGRPRNDIDELES